MNKIDPTRTVTNRQPAIAPPRTQRVARYWLMMLGCLCLAVGGCAAAAIQPPAPVPGVAPVPPPPPPAPYNGPTLWNCLGVPQCAAATKTCAEKVCTCLKRQFPGPGSEFPNLGEVGPDAAPAVKCAAEIIAAEAEAPQKIDALRYLGKVGCTKCYPCVEEGLIAALDDCTEVVRYEAAKAIRATATEQCKCCQCTSCCTQKVYEKLYKVAYETNSQGCPVECSSRVRRVARQALCMCGGPMASDEPEEPTPTEGPSGAPPAVTPPADVPAASAAPATVPPPAPPATASAAASTQKPSESTPPNAPPTPEKSVVPEKKETATAVEAAATSAKSTAEAGESSPDKVEQKTSAVVSPTPSTVGPILKIATESASPPSMSQMPLTTGMPVVEPAAAENCKACGNHGTPAPSPAGRFRYSWQSSDIVQ